MGPGLGQIVDSINQSVGTLVDPKAGVVFRKVGDDFVVFQAFPAGLTQAPLTFYHTQAGCQGARYVWNFNMGGFAYFGQIVSGTVFYTRTMDSSQTAMVTSSEVVMPNADPSQPGVCTDWGGSFAMNVAPATSSTELSTLVAPFKIQ